MKARLLSVLRREEVMIGTISFVSFISGGAMYHLLYHKQIEQKYVAIAEEEIAEAKLFYSKLYKSEAFETPEQAVEALINDEEALTALRSYGGVAVEIDPSAERGTVTLKSGDSEVKIVNAFDHEEPPVAPDEEFDYATELARRDPEKPYIISVDEFTQGDAGFDQFDLTYFDGDGVLADTRDQLFDEDAIGGSNLKFGYGSRDENIVYVRNEALSMDFEISKSIGSYTQEVMGYNPEEDTGGELKHSQRRRDFRRGDDG